MKRARAVAFLALALGGCAADYVTTNDAAVNLYIVSVTSASGGTVLRSDVNPPVSDFVTLALANRTKNPNQPLEQKVALAIMIERYEVRFYRSDGRGVEGIDVPYRISGNVTAALDADNGGTVPLLVEAVRAQAKMEPPLANLKNGGQSQFLTMFAEITVHGRTIAGQAVQATGRIQVDFSDYAS
jgi:hypothetical protein